MHNNSKYWRLIVTKNNLLVDLYSFFYKQNHYNAQHLLKEQQKNKPNTCIIINIKTI